MSQFEKNPIMLFMHTRPFSNQEDQVLAVGHWEDIEVKDDVISAVPVFDEDDFSTKIYNKVESGTYRMASAAFDPVETSGDPDVLLPGQKFASITKSIMEEASICDLGVNQNALAFSKNGKLITLTSENIFDFIPEIKKQKTMTINLATLAVALTLAADASEESVLKEAIKRISEHASLAEKNVQLAQKLADVETERKQEKNKRMVDDAATAGKITDEQKPFYLKLAEGNPETTEALLSSMKPYKSIESQMTEKHEATDDDKVLKMAWNDLDKANKLAYVRANHPDVYKAKFKEKFGKEPDQLK